MSATETTGSHSLARTLGAIVQNGHDGAVLRRDLEFGDRLTVRTRNSIYWIWVLGDGSFAVSGGWFDQQGLSPAVLQINGCTYGGSVIRHDIVAAPGLFLEFANQVSTTRIMSVSLQRQGGEQGPAPV